MVYEKVNIEYHKNVTNNFIFEKNPQTFKNALCEGNSDYIRSGRMHYHWFLEDPLYSNPYYNEAYQLRHYEIGHKYDMLVINNYTLVEPNLIIDYCDVNLERALVSVNAIFGRLQNESCYPIKYRIICDGYSENSNLFWYYETVSEEDRFGIGNSFENEFILDEFIDEFKKIYHNFVRIDFFIEYYGK